MSMNYLSPKDLWNDGKERGNLSWWCKVDEGCSSLPQYRCANCGKYLFYDSPECYCGNCGSLMANYYLVRDEYAHAEKELVAKKEGVANDIS